MILVDTSVWIDHFRQGEERLLELLEAKSVVTHPLIIEKLACGHLKSRREIIHLMQTLPSAPAVSHQEILFLIDQRTLYGAGLGAIDVHLIAAAMLGGTLLWSKDKAMTREARRLGFCAD